MVMAGIFYTINMKSQMLKRAIVVQWRGNKKLCLGIIKAWAYLPSSIPGALLRTKVDVTSGDYKNLKYFKWTLSCSYYTSSDVYWKSAELC